MEEITITKIINCINKNTPKWYEVVPTNIGKAVIAPITALITNQDTVLFGNNIMAMNVFRDLTLLCSISSNYMLGKTNSATTKKYCSLDILAASLKAISKTVLLAPKFIYSDNIEVFSKLARNVNFVTEPIALFINKGIREGGDDPLEYISNHADLSWLSEVLLGGIIRALVYDNLGEFITYLNLNEYIYDPLYNSIDNFSMNYLCNIEANITSKDVFLDRINLVESSNSSLVSLPCKTMLFSSNVFHGFNKDIIGWKIVAPLTRISYDFVSKYLEESSEMVNRAALFGSAAYFMYSGYEIYEAYREVEVTGENVEH